MSWYDDIPNPFGFVNPNTEGDIYGSNPYTNNDNFGLGGSTPALGAGIAGVNTPSRKLGQANNPGQDFVTSGPLQVTKAQKRDARTMRNHYGLGSGDVFQDRNTGIVWQVNENGKGIKALGTMTGENQVVWETGDRIFTAGRNSQTGEFIDLVGEIGWQVYNPNEDPDNPTWSWEVAAPVEESPIIDIRHLQLFLL